MIKENKLLFLLVAFCFFIGCGTSATIKLGMSKDEVVASLWEPTIKKGKIITKHGQIIEVWEYRLSSKDYWLYFYDDRLVQWKQVGDWQEEADKIYEINFDKKKKQKKE